MSSMPYVRLVCKICQRFCDTFRQYFAVNGKILPITLWISPSYPHIHKLIHVGTVYALSKYSYALSGQPQPERTAL